ncbi:acyl-CoA dehydrogenase family protein [Methylobacterium sp. J-077]|uniref:acyl-CoA dehydrogenase family protein n=1 Tax=Methylobacterium sp. J-077 TaxID=2836656 RepID=UPI001FBA7A37|nr:acyl-CoA dehydrogenase family protein [Methylobacterium sp. J-077]MCJ2121925.1 acyl-CoA dehydrogenase family protein [Methylobacterium sp. J-077]
MSQRDAGWGAGPSERYEELADRFRPVFAEIRATAVERDRTRGLPHAEIGWLKEAGFTTLRLPVEAGGHGASLPELFNLLIELSQADSNVTNALRAHFGFTEDVLGSTAPDWRARWIARIAAGETVGSGVSETGAAKVGQFDTVVRRRGADLVVSGKKFYTTGSLFADYIHLSADDEDGAAIVAAVPTRAPGVEIVDDWDGFGQALTASGTIRLDDVVLAPELIKPDPDRFPYAMAFFQLVHLATLAGIGRAAAEDVGRLVAERTRIYSHGNAGRTADDPQILAVVGRVRGNAYAAGAVALKAAESLQRASELHRDAVCQGVEATGEAERATALADVEVNQAVTVVTNLVLEATTILFDALGASAVKHGLGLDRYWRNARTIASHNPRIYRDRIVGAFAVNGTEPPRQYRVGSA